MTIFFSEIHISQIITPSNGTYVVSLPFSITIPFYTLPIFSATFELPVVSTQVTSSQPPSLSSQLGSSSIPTTFSQPITYVPISLLLPPLFMPPHLPVPFHKLLCQSLPLAFPNLPL